MSLKYSNYAAKTYIIYIYNIVTVLKRQYIFNICWKLQYTNVYCYLVYELGLLYFLLKKLQFTRIFYQWLCAYKLLFNTKKVFHENKFSSKYQVPASINIFPSPCGIWYYSTQSRIHPQTCKDFDRWNLFPCQTLY